jgi:hypothetical protein
MKKLLLTLAAGAALTIGLAGHAAPAFADPPSADFESCTSVPVLQQSPYVDPDGAGPADRIRTCII